MQRQTLIPSSLLTLRGEVLLFEWRDLVILGIAPKFVIFVMGGPLGIRTIFSGGLGIETNS